MPISEEHLYNGLMAELRQINNVLSGMRADMREESMHSNQAFGLNEDDFQKKAIAETRKQFDRLTNQLSENEHDERTVELLDKLLKATNKSNDLKDKRKLKEQQNKPIKELTDLLKQNAQAEKERESRSKFRRSQAAMQNAQQSDPNKGMLGDVFGVGGNLMEAFTSIKDGWSNFLGMSSKSKQEKGLNLKDKFEKKQGALVRKRQELQDRESIGIEDEKTIKLRQTVDKLENSLSGLADKMSVLYKDVSGKSSSQASDFKNRVLSSAGIDPDKNEMSVGGIMAPAPQTTQLLDIENIPMPSDKPMDSSFGIPNLSELIGKESRQQQSNANRSTQSKTEKGESGLIDLRSLFTDSLSDFSDKMASQMMRAQSTEVPSNLMGNIPAVELEQREDDKMLATEFWDAPVASTDSPTNVGQYVAGIYGQMSMLNKSLSSLLKTDEKESSILSSLEQAVEDSEGMGGGDGEGGGIIDSISGSISGFAKKLTPLLAIGGIGSLLFGKQIGSAMTPLFSMLGGQDQQTANMSGQALGENLQAGGAHAATQVGVAGARAGAKGLEKVGTILGKEGLEMGGKAILKKIPIISVLAGVGFGLNRIFEEGDWTGAALEVASGLAGTVPGLGTAGSLAIDAGLAARDVKRAFTGEAAAARLENGPKFSGGDRPFGTAIKPDATSKMLPLFDRTKNPYALQPLSANTKTTYFGSNGLSPIQTPSLNVPSANELAQNKIAEAELFAKFNAKANFNIMKTQPYQNYMQNNNKQSANAINQALNNY